jgi:hypothetical protein
MDGNNQQRPPPPKAAGLNNILNSDHAPGHIPNGPPHMRDSGFYSNGDASSKRTLLIATRSNTLVLPLTRLIQTHLLPLSM